MCLKVDVVDSCGSLKDLLSKLCLESNKKYKMDSTDFNEATGDDPTHRKISLVISVLKVVSIKEQRSSFCFTASHFFLQQKSGL